MSKTKTKKKKINEHLNAKTKEAEVKAKQAEAKEAELKKETQEIQEEIKKGDETLEKIFTLTQTKRYEELLEKLESKITRKETRASEKGTAAKKKDEIETMKKLKEEMKETANHLEIKKDLTNCKEALNKNENISKERLDSIKTRVNLINQNLEEIKNDKAKKNDMYKLMKQAERLLGVKGKN
ncbi:MAG: hypothetical protein NMK33_04480 [Candidatus Cardinium sp.]|nr:MAG: hypothetical protein NMK33_04480 [Candidatus Cardinium sp.]